MDLQIVGKRVFVSGSTAGIGYAVAATLAREGAEVIINGRTRERVEQALGSIRKRNPEVRVSGIAADLGTAEGASQLLQELGEADILINNVGIYEAKAFPDITDQDWFRMFEINVMSGVRLSRRLLPGMIERNWGRVIFISSESGINIPVEMVHYGLTKSSQLALSRGLAETTVGTAVTVNAVLPGPTRSEGVGNFVEEMAQNHGVSQEDMTRQFFEKMRPTSLIRRFADVEEVAYLVACVASPLAAAINGAALRVDGGVVRSIY